MKHIRFSVIAIVATAFLFSCSSTVLNESWKSPEYSGKLENVYIIGVAKNDSTRRIFEDSFNKNLTDSGVKGFVSYKDFADDQKADKDDVLQKAKEYNAGAILTTRMLKKETETVVNPGRVSTYSSGGYYGSSHNRSYARPTGRRPSTASAYRSATRTRSVVPSLAATKSASRPARSS